MVQAPVERVEEPCAWQPRPISRVSKNQVVIPFQTSGFYNYTDDSWRKERVVIPFQTSGFYNLLEFIEMRQLVVIPPRMSGFYNPIYARHVTIRNEFSYRPEWYKLQWGA